MSIKDYLKNKPVLFNLLIAILALFLFANLCLLFLTIYTHHWQSITVPDYKGLSKKEYVAQTRKKNLRYEVIDSIFLPDKKPGTVIVQFPAAGSKVKSHRTIYLTIASQTPEKVPVPKVIDVGLREAASRLENTGLKVGLVIYRPAEFTDLVLEQRFNDRPISKGELIPKGSAIDLVVGKGLSNESVNVPALVGLSLNEARSILYRNNLTTGALIYDNSVVSSYDSVNAQIWKQAPDANQNNFIEQGSSIDIWLTIDQTKINPPSEVNSADGPGEF